MTAVFGEILVGRISFWSIFTVIAWIIFWGRCGWTATLMVPPVVFSVLTPACDAPWIDAPTIQAATVGLGIGGWMDVCGLATTRDAAGSDSRLLTAHSKETFAESCEQKPASRGGMK
ncbi:MAG: hypothetical protein ACKV2Q_13960 [Planctomycetaceae bacterium]